MQVTNKQEILNLLNLDSLIKDYLDEPRLNRKTPAANNKPKTIRVTKCPNNELYDSVAAPQKAHTYSIYNNEKLMKTVGEHFVNKKNLSVGSINKKTVQDYAINKIRTHTTLKTFSNLQKKESGKDDPNDIVICRTVKAPKSKPCMPSKVFKMDEEEGGCEIEIPKKKWPAENQSTNVNEDSMSEDNIEKEYESINLRTVNKNARKIMATNSKMGVVLKDRYRCEKLIGRGLSGEVYKAKDILSERLVAIKFIDLKNVEYEFIKKFQHSNIISYYNSFVEGNKRCLVLEYLPKSLAEVARKRKFTAQEIKRVFKAIAAGLMYLHSMSYVHRDIKLDNLVTNQDLTVIKFIDFGLCLDSSECDAKQIKRICGTASYMAPEVISGNCLDPKKMDIWSLGIVLYILSVGRNPFLARTEQDILNKIKNSKTIFPPEMDSDLKSLLSKMLDKNAENRPSIYDIANSKWVTG